ncbi:MAG: hypothetical protein L0Y56_09055 [Nitrospira sp.]|nr:hypothetical protein [Nitrospira sp.]
MTSKLQCDGCDAQIKANDANGQGWRKLHIEIGDPDEDDDHVLGPQKWIYDLCRKCMSHFTTNLLPLKWLRPEPEGKSK